MEKHIIKQTKKTHRNNMEIIKKTIVCTIMAVLYMFVILGSIVYINQGINEILLLIPMVYIATFDWIWSCKIFGKKIIMILELSLLMLWGICFSLSWFCIDSPFFHLPFIKSIRMTVDIITLYSYVLWEISLGIPVLIVVIYLLAQYIKNKHGNTKRK